MKKGKNIFFHGQPPMPLPSSALRGYNYKQPLCACGVAGLIKNIFLSFFISSSICQADAVAPQVCHLDNCVSVEVVSQPADMQHGLMFRESLPQDAGMLFVFAHDDIPNFWMKNMSFNLDIVWISHEGRIVFINHNVPPCREDFFCPVYAPHQACRYVLELNGGYTVSHDWKQGDNLNLGDILT